VETFYVLKWSPAIDNGPGPHMGLGKASAAIERRLSRRKARESVKRRRQAIFPTVWSVCSKKKKLGRSGSQNSTARKVSPLWGGEKKNNGECKKERESKKKTTPGSLDPGNKSCSGNDLEGNDRIITKTADKESKRGRQTGRAPGTRR